VGQSRHDRLSAHLAQRPDRLLPYIHGRAAECVDKRRDGVLTTDFAEGANGRSLQWLAPSMGGGDQFIKPLLP
jgi:hypothetical protein